MKKQNRYPKADDKASYPDRSLTLASMTDDESSSSNSVSELPELYAQLKRIQSSKGLINHAQRADLLSRIGRVHRERDEITNAMDAHLEAMEIYKGVYGGEDNHFVARTLRDIGDVHLESGDLSQAVDSYMDSLKLTRMLQSSGNVKDDGSIRTETVNDECYSLDTGITLMKIGSVARKQNDPDVALPSLLLSLEEFKRVSKSKSSEYTQDLYEQIGDVYNVDFSSYPEARESYKESRRIIASSDFLKCWSLDDKIGLMNLRLGEWKDAKSLFLSTLRAKEKHFGKESLDVSRTKILLARLFLAESEYRKSMEMALSALTVQKENLRNNDKGNVELAQTLNLIGDVHFYQKEYNFAMSAYTDALNLKEKCDKEHYITRKECAKTLTCIAKVHYAKDNFGDALDILEEARHLQEEVLDSDHLDNGKLMHFLGSIKQRLHPPSLEEAMDHHIEALSIFQSQRGTTNVDVACILFDMGEIHRQWGDEKEALTVLTEARRLQENHVKATGQSNSTDLAQTLFATARIHEKVGHKDLAISTYRSSLAAYRAAGYDGDNPGLRLVVDKLSNLDDSIETQIVSSTLSWTGILVPDRKYYDGTVVLDAVSFMYSSLFGPCLNEDRDV